MSLGRDDIKDGETICEHGNRPFECHSCRIIRIPDAHPLMPFNHNMVNGGPFDAGPSDVPPMERTMPVGPSKVGRLALMEPFEQWWERLGQHIHHQDTEKCVRLAWEAARAQSRNYVADEKEMPSEVTFANGRIVKIINRTDGILGYYLDIKG